MTKDYNNEILNDCVWFAEKHRGKNKQSGAHWSTIIRFTPLFDEAVRLQNQFRTLLKSIEIGDDKQIDIDKLQSEYDQLRVENERLKEALKYIEVNATCMTGLTIRESVQRALKEVTK